MNLIQMIHKTIQERLSSSKTLSDKLSIKFKNLEMQEQEMINDFFIILLGCSFADLVACIDKKKQKPITRNISITWSTEDVQNIRPDLTDEQASRILESLVKYHNADVGINWEVIEAITSSQYPQLGHN